MFERPKAFKDCIELCWTCRNTCQDTLFNHCLEMGGSHVAPDHVKVMMDCIQMCQVCADVMTRNSAQHMATCQACADICDACAISCEQVSGDAMMACATVCQKCGTACRHMSHLSHAA